MRHIGKKHDENDLFVEKKEKKQLQFDFMCIILYKSAEISGFQCVEEGATLHRPLHKTTNI